MSPAPAPREREGPIAQQWEGEGLCIFAQQPLTLPQPAAAPSLSRREGEG